MKPWIETQDVECDACGKLVGRSARVGNTMHGLYLCESCVDDAARLFNAGAARAAEEQAQREAKR